MQTQRKPDRPQPAFEDIFIVHPGMGWPSLPVRTVLFYGAAGLQKRDGLYVLRRPDYEAVYRVQIRADEVWMWEDWNPERSREVFQRQEWERDILPCMHPVLGTLIPTDGRFAAYLARMGERRERGEEEDQDTSLLGRGGGAQPGKLSPPPTPSPVAEAGLYSPQADKEPMMTKAEMTPVAAEGNGLARRNPMSLARSESDPSRYAIVFESEGEIFADSRDVAAFFERRHDLVLRSVRDLHCSEEFRLRNFAAFKNNDLTGDHTSHVLMTKDGFAFLAMGFTGAKAAKFKEAYIQQFNAMEAELRKRAAVDPSTVLEDPAAMRGLLLTYTEKVIALEGEVEDMRPQVQALERIAISEGSLCVTDAAKTLQIRPKDLFNFLRSHRWVYRRAGSASDIAYQDRLVSGLLEHKVTTVYRSDGSEKTATQVRVTAKGMTRLAKLIEPVARVVSEEKAA